MREVTQNIGLSKKASLIYKNDNNLDFKQIYRIFKLCVGSPIFVIHDNGTHIVVRQEFRGQL